MDKLSAHQRTLKQANKPKKKPVKVVYISNPMRVKASAAQFKSLVQELTGQYSDIADLAKLADPGLPGQVAANDGSSSTTADDYLATAHRAGLVKEELHQRQDQGGGPLKSGGDPFDMLGEVFTPDVLEDLDWFMRGIPY